MGQAVRKRTSTSSTRTPRLRLVSSRARRRPTRSSAAREAQCRDLFGIACLLMLVIALFGVGRVMLSAKAVEASMDASRLRSDIKSERYTGSVLEADRSALATPSRIECIAEGSLKMAQAPEIRYITVPKESGVAAACVTAEHEDAVSTRTTPLVQGAATVGTADGVPMPPRRSGVVAGVIASVMELAAGEAHVLLVGDVGLATTK